MAGRSTRRLWRECEARVAGLVIPRPFSLKALADQVSRSRGRRLFLHELPFPPGPDMPCGIWVATPEADHVFHAKGTSALHQQNIVLHELGHMLCDHTLGDDDSLAGLLTHLDPAVVRRVLMRSRYSTRQEQEAEMIATLILEKAGWPSSRAPGPDDGLGTLNDLFGVPDEP